MPTISAVVFDLDGTLFDHIGSARAGVTGWLASIGHAADDSLLAAWFKLEERYHVEWREGRIGWLEQRRRRFRDFLPLIGQPVGDDEELDRRFEDEYLGRYRAAWVGFGDAREAVLEIRTAGLGVGILTNGAEAQQRAKLERIGLLDLVGPVLTAEGIGVAKPRPEAFTQACAALELAPEQVLYVGDDHVVDVLGARAAGLAAVHLDRSAPADAWPNTIRSLSGLAARLVSAQPH